MYSSCRKYIVSDAYEDVNDESSPAKNGIAHTEYLDLCQRNSKLSQIESTSESEAALVGSPGGLGSLVHNYSL